MMHIIINIYIKEFNWIYWFQYSSLIDAKENINLDQPRIYGSKYKIISDIVVCFHAGALYAYTFCVSVLKTHLKKRFAHYVIC